MDAKALHSVERKFTYRFDRVIAGILEFLEIIYGNTVFGEHFERLVDGSGNLRAKWQKRWMGTKEKIATRQICRPKILVRIILFQVLGVDAKLHADRAIHEKFDSRLTSSSPSPISPPSYCCCASM